MAFYALGGWTEYWWTGLPHYQDPDPDPLKSDPDLWGDEWGDNSVDTLTAPGNFYRLMGRGRTNAVLDGSPIWYRTFFTFTSDPNPNKYGYQPYEIVGGRQLFWSGNQHIEDFQWGQVDLPDWIGIGVSGDLHGANSGWAKQLVNELSVELEGGPDIPGPPDVPGFPPQSSPGDFTPDGPSGIVPGGGQLYGIAKHPTFGWSLEQARVYMKPPDPNASVSIVGRSERTKDLDEQHDWVTTDAWGRHNTDTSHIMGLGVWKTEQFGWGPSITSLYFAPTR